MHKMQGSQWQGAYEYEAVEAEVRCVRSERGLKDAQRSFNTTGSNRLKAQSDNDIVERG